MVLTIAPYNPSTKINDVQPGGIDHPAGSSIIRVDLRVLTRYGEVIVDFGGFTDVLSWRDSLSVEGPSGTWSLRMKALLSNEELLKKIHPGMVIEFYAARNDDPLVGVIRDPSTIDRIDTTPDFPKVAVVPTTVGAVSPTASNATASISTASVKAGSYGGTSLSSEQVQNAAIIARVGQQVGASERDITIAIMTALQESTLRNLDYGDRDSLGLFQQRPSMDWGTPAQIQDPEYSARVFFQGVGTNPGLFDLSDRNSMSLGQAAQAVQRSAYPDEYDKWESTATDLLRSFGGSSVSQASSPAIPAPAPAQVAAVIGKEIEPVDDPYLDKCPYLVMRGIITDYGRSTEDQTSLTITGESFGKIYKDAFVLTDLNAPELAGTSIEFRGSVQIPLGVSLIYYRLLKEWVEGFWGKTTGWEARTRPIPFPPNYVTRINNEGSVWSNLEFLAIRGFFHIFVDHTGAIVWEKLPWSSREQSLIAGRNWEDLPLLQLPSWKIISWNDRLSEQGITNFLRCVPTQQGTSGGQDRVSLPGFIYNIGSIRQYGGPSKRELFFPVGSGANQYYTSEPRRKEQATIQSFTALAALEAIRWYDRPVQRCGVSVMGDAAWRIHTRIELAENWHLPEAKLAQYYVSARSNSIDVASGRWTTELDLVRDRRSRYLGIGVGDLPVILDSLSANADALDSKKFTQTENFSFAGLAQTGNVVLPPDVDTGSVAVAERSQIEIPLVPDEYYFFDRLQGKVIAIGNDPIAWARQEVIPKLGKESKVQQTTPPNSGIGGSAPPFTPVVDPNGINWNDPSFKISKYFTVGDVTKGEPNRIPQSASVINNILRLASELDKIREAWGSGIGVTSWYRPIAINTAIGGAPGSQHIEGSAVDIYALNGREQEFEQFLDQGWGGALGYGVASGRGFTHLDLRGGGWQHGNGSIRWNY